MKNNEGKPEIETPLVPEEKPAPHDIIRSAQSMLDGAEQKGLTTLGQYMEPEPQVPQTVPDVQVLDRVPDHNQSTLIASHFQKFANLAQQLRNQEQINLYEVKKLNLAAAVETLERQVHAHEAFPSSDAGLAVSAQTETVLKIIKDLEKSTDPYEGFGKIMDDVLFPLTEEMVHSLASEMKWLKQNTIQMVPPEHRKAFEETLKEAVNRVGPSFKDALEVAKARMLKVMNLKDK